MTADHNLNALLFIFILFYRDCCVVIWSHTQPLIAAYSPFASELVYQTISICVTHNWRLFAIRSHLRIVCLFCACTNPTCFGINVRAQQTAGRNTEHPTNGTRTHTAHLSDLENKENRKYGWIHKFFSARGRLMTMENITTVETMRCVSLSRPWKRHVEHNIVSQFRLALLLSCAPVEKTKWKALTSFWIYSRRFHSDFLYISFRVVTLLSFKCNYIWAKFQFAFRNFFLHSPQKVVNLSIHLLQRCVCVGEKYTASLVNKFSLIWTFGCAVAAT